jgi:putative two-component system response regulator
MPAHNRILAVDDNPMNLAVIEESLQGRFNLRLAHDGNEALGLAPTFLPDVVLLDVMMPKPDGFEVCSKMKNSPDLCHSQIIMVSARTNIEDRLRGYRAGADDYVTKPFEEEELYAKVYAAVRTREMYGTIRHQVESFCSATGETLELMSYLRDAETGEHIARMRDYAHLLAAELREGPLAHTIDDLFLDNLYRASALHDIGKVAIPDAILRKPGPLTPSEREQMQTHTLIGEQILNRLARQQPDVSFFHMAAEVARWHHECFDGSGYPDGLIGENIPLAARIVKVADVFDALTTQRVYKPRINPLEARKQIVDDKEHAFDPIVIDAMLRIFDDLVDICRSNESESDSESPSSAIVTF